MGYTTDTKLFGSCIKPILYYLFLKPWGYKYNPNTTQGYASISWNASSHSNGINAGGYAMHRCSVLTMDTYCSFYGIQCNV